ncbi:uclacyanin 1-like [Panicum virgatum]|uniref:uclacyanin 1-like n=1 Tax=Panicum virgatum TaxID=38727 RepID=UPI0019D5B8C6|nr:uclacyanin 1-like [Panicum virgatum]
MTGSDTVRLDGGERYFICGAPGHCAAGMKLQVRSSAAGDAGCARTSPPRGALHDCYGSPPPNTTSPLALDLDAPATMAARKMSKLRLRAMILLAAVLLLLLPSAAVAKAMAIDASKTQRLDLPDGLVGPRASPSTAAIVMQL